MCLAVKKKKEKRDGCCVSIQLMNLYPLRWVLSLLQWNSVLITEQEGDGEHTDREIAGIETACDIQQAVNPQVCSLKTVPGCLML